MNDWTELDDAVIFVFQAKKEIEQSNYSKTPVQNSWVTSAEGYFRKALDTVDMSF